MEGAGHSRARLATQGSGTPETASRVLQVELLPKGSGWPGTDAEVAAACGPSVTEQMLTALSGLTLGGGEGSCGL